MKQKQEALSPSENAMHHFPLRCLGMTGLKYYTRMHFKQRAGGNYSYFHLMLVTPLFSLRAFTLAHTWRSGEHPDKFNVFIIAHPLNYLLLSLALL